MGKINMGRVILGGIIAGVIINLVEGVMNGVILQPQWSQAAKAIGRSATMSPKQIVAFNVWGFAAGIIAIWLYAAMRPRFGAGPKTAIQAGAALWLLAYAMANGMMAFLHIFPLGLLLTVTAVGLVEVLIAATVGAYFYKET
ncbi:membrane hypothetical protein [Candidatus Sulfopaludibacter sp. SbA3]|nr:membrane hypothetical protein [Candidatus Sulfopaludibacter sp. SbA3]